MQVQGEITITWASGLHIRPATLIVQLLQKYKAQVEFIKNGKTCNAKSVIQLLTLGAENQEKLSIVASGDDASAAMEALLCFFSQYNENILW